MENQDQEKTDVNVSQAGQPSEPASPQPPEPAKPGVVPFESPVKSRQQLVQETVDRNLAERAARQKITDDLKKKRTYVEVAAAIRRAETGPALVKGLRSAADMVEAETAAADQFAAGKAIAEQEAEAVQAANDAVQVVTPPVVTPAFDSAIDRAAEATNKIMDEVMRTSQSRELREIAMHNAMMDANKESMAQAAAMCDLLSDIGGSLQRLVVVAEKINFN